MNTTENIENDNKLVSAYKIFVQFNEYAWTPFINLINKNGVAGAIFLLFSQLSDSTNQVKASIEDICFCLNTTENTVRKALKLLQESCFIEIRKSGNENIYNVNSYIVFKSGKNTRIKSHYFKVLEGCTKQNKGAPYKSILHINAANIKFLILLAIENKNAAALLFYLVKKMNFDNIYSDGKAKIYNNKKSKDDFHLNKNVVFKCFDLLKNAKFINTDLGKNQIRINAYLFCKVCFPKDEKFAKPIWFTTEPINEHYGWKHSIEDVLGKIKGKNINYCIVKSEKKYEHYYEELEECVNRKKQSKISANKQQTSAFPDTETITELSTKYGFKDLDMDKSILGYLPFMCKVPKEYEFVATDEEKVVYLKILINQYLNKQKRIPSFIVDSILNNRVTVNFDTNYTRFVSAYLTFYDSRTGYSENVYVNSLNRQKREISKPTGYWLIGEENNPKKVYIVHNVFDAISLYSLILEWTKLSDINFAVLAVYNRNEENVSMIKEKFPESSIYFVDSEESYEIAVDLVDSEESYEIAVDSDIKHCRLPYPTINKAYQAYITYKNYGDFFESFKQEL